MKTRIIKYNMTFGARRDHTKPHQGTLIENLDDLNAYCFELGHSVRKGVSRFVTSNLPMEKIDHAVPSAPVPEKSLMRMALLRGDTLQVNPIHQLDTIAAEKIQTFRRFLDEGRKIVVSEVGSYCFLSDDDEVLEIYDKEDGPAKRTIILTKTSKVIVLENDMVLPYESRQHLRKNFNEDFSVVYDLRFNMKHLPEALRNFKNYSGEEVYVYTTGLDVEQMHEYTESIISAGITKLSIELSDEQPEKSSPLGQYFTKYFNDDRIRLINIRKAND